MQYKYNANAIQKIIRSSLAIKPDNMQFIRSSVVVINW